MKLFCVNSQYSEEDFIAFSDYDCNQCLIYDYAEFLGIDRDIIESDETVRVTELPTPSQIMEFFRKTIDCTNVGMELFSVDELKEIALYCAFTDEQYETIERLF